MLAILKAMRTWRPYLLGKKFFIKTDYRIPKYLLEQQIITSKQQKLVAKLLGYDYEIVRRPGRENSAADSLSRVQDSPIINSLIVPHVHLWEEIKKTVINHAYINDIAQLARSKPRVSYSLWNGLIFYKNRVVITPNTLIINQLLKEFHDTKVGGHLRVLRTFKRLKQQFY